ncbi:MAG: hypothetical protein KAI50_12905 [Desulfobacterales bacterium]|nr:hypothetical protein [Desulfobacterales bacterium]
MNGFITDQDVGKTLLIIGVHVEELRFGEKVAEGAKELGIDVLRIEHGLSNDRFLYANLFYYDTFLRELYLQTHMQIQGKYSLAIDLHTGFNQAGCCADVFCKETCVLNCLHSVLQNKLIRGNLLSKKVRLMKIVKDMAVHPKLADPAYLPCKTFIPETVWEGRHYHYVGLEIYLPSPGRGSREDCLFARQLVKCIHECGKKLRNVD